MPRADRLLDLSTYRSVLRQSRYATLSAYQTAANHPELGACAPEIAQLVAAGDPDVLAALSGPVDWSAGGDGGVSRLTIAWTADDPDGERLAWIALRAALRPRRARTGTD